MTRYRGRHRKPSSTRKVLARTALAGAVVGVPLVAPGAAHAASDAAWDKLAECESGGNWSINNGNGYHGGLQFSPRTWKAFGGAEFAPTANQATREEQIVVGERVLAEQGWGAWPGCSKKMGLRGEPAGQRPAPDAPAPTETRASGNAGSYTVKSGDTLSSIAAEHQVPGGWQALLDKNPSLNGDPNRITPGQQLAL